MVTQIGRQDVIEILQNKMNFFGALEVRMDARK